MRTGQPDGQAAVSKEDAVVGRLRGWLAFAYLKALAWCRAIKNWADEFEVASVTACIGAIGTALALWLLWGIFGAGLVSALISVRNGEEPKVSESQPRQVSQIPQRLRVAVPSLGSAASAVDRVEVQVNVHAPEPQPEPEESRLAKMGQAGDSYGGANALFSALAGALVCWAGLLQRRALLDARKTNKQQQFDAIFFELLGLVRTLEERLRRVGPNAQRRKHIAVRRLNSRPSRAPHPHVRDEARGDGLGVQLGAQAIGAWAQALSERVRQDTHDYSLPDSESYFASYFHRNIYEPNASSLGPYMRVLVRIFSHIDRADISIEEKKQYLALVQGVLSQDAILLAVAFSLGPEGSSLKAYVFTFGLLDQLDDEQKGFLFNAFYPNTVHGACEPQQPMPYHTPAGRKKVEKLLRAMRVVDWRHVPGVGKSALY